MLIFFMQPIAFGSWLPRIPDVQNALSLGPATLAIALLGLPCGTLLTLPFAGPLVGRIGAKSAIVYGFMLYCIAISLPGFAMSLPVLFVALMLAGSSISFVELGLNVMADRVEKETGSVIMSTSHGCWSLGIMAGSVIGSLLAGAGVEARWAIMGVSIVSLPIALLIAGQLHDYGPEQHVAAAEQRSAWSPPSWALLGIGAFVFGITITEGAMADWSAVFLRNAFSAPPAEAGIGYSVFAFLVATGRFGGDSLRKRFGGVTLARAFGLLALVGVGILLVAPTTMIALIGFGIVGLGVSVGFPLAVTAAASLTDRASSGNVAILSFIALVGFLVGPPVIGFIAEHVAIRIGLAALLPVLALSLVTTGRLVPSRPQIADPQANVPGVL
ncbi:MFS transporter [Devosia sp.]|uniref:MFS transporter n=1 Tax=Devosia sp. TaxID=1871048 RepID=UPI0032662D4B